MFDAVIYQQLLTAYMQVFMVHILKQLHTLSTEVKLITQVSIYLKKKSHVLDCFELINKIKQLHALQTV